METPALDDWCQNREVMNALIKQHLMRARFRMKRQADKRRSERQFEVGDKVFLKLQPYIQSSLAPRANQKLSFKFFGPYDIIERVGKVAYKLLLPANSSIHPVFHVSQLKKMIPSDRQVSESTPDDIESPRVPIKILDSRYVRRGTFSVSQVLVQWSNWQPSLATWEDLVSLKQRFPAAPA